MSDTPNAATALTDDERRTVRDAALGALALVSRADPGFFSTFKESMAGSRALAEAPEAVKAILQAPGLPKPPTGSPEQVTNAITTGLQAAVGLLKGKAPDQVEPYRQAVLAGCDAVAKASKGVSPEEAQAIETVRGALASGGPATPQGTPPPMPGAGDAPPAPSA